MRIWASFAFAIGSAVLVCALLGLTGWQSGVVAFLVAWFAADIFPARRREDYSRKWKDYSFNYAADDYMCPNCVTPWKCNGPHEAQRT